MLNVSFKGFQPYLDVATVLGTLLDLKMNLNWLYARVACIQKRGSRPIRVSLEENVMVFI